MMDALLSRVSGHAWDRDMCSHDEGIRDPQNLRALFKVEPSADMGKADLWPGYPGLLIRCPRENDSGDDAVPDREALPGLFGLVPQWATDLKICRSTYNARSETVATQPLMNQFHKPTDEKRMVVVLPEAAFDE
jgi:putative SOS response-associated peptidase YedK